MDLNTLYSHPLFFWAICFGIIAIAIAICYTFLLKRIYSEKDKAFNAIKEGVRADAFTLFQKELESQRVKNAELESRAYFEKESRIQIEDRLKELLAQGQEEKTSKRELTRVTSKEEMLYSEGYMVINVPEFERGLFTDLLKGFEEYACLKGYKISFSVDNSMPGKVAFKFTFTGRGVQVSEDVVRKDIETYLGIIRTGGSFEEMPMVISPIEHALVMRTLADRIKFLQDNYNLEKEMRQSITNLLKDFHKNSHQNYSTPPIIIQNGNTPKNLIANHSSHINQGEEVFYDNNGDYSQITISNSFNKKKEQIDKLDELIELIRKEQISDLQKNDMIYATSQLKEEISVEEQPQKSRIFRYLNKIKTIGEGLVLSHETSGALKWLYESFNYIFV